jgi:hypothetical protein
MIKEGNKNKIYDLEERTYSFAKDCRNYVKNYQEQYQTLSMASS